MVIHKIVLVNETQKTLWDFEIKMDPLMPVGRADFVFINKKKKHNI